MTTQNIFPSPDEFKKALLIEKFINEKDAIKITQAFKNNSFFSYISIAAFGVATNKRYEDPDNTSTTLQYLSKNNRNEWKSLVEDMKKEGLIDGLGEKELDEALDLFLTGKAEKDIKNSAEGVWKTILQLTNIENLKKSIQTITDTEYSQEWLSALAMDITNEDREKLFSNLLGKINNDPFGSFATNIINILIAKDNRTMRLAIIAYARMNGFKINDENLDQLGKAFRQNNPTLSPAMVGAIKYFKNKYGDENYIDKVINFLNHKPVLEAGPS